MTMRVARLLCLVAVLPCALAVAGPAQAAPPSLTTVVNALQSAPYYYIDPAATVTPQQKRAIARAAARAHARMRLALLSSVPAGAPNALAAASAIRTRLKGYHGVVALSFAKARLAVSAASPSAAKVAAARQAAGTKRNVAALLGFADAY